MKFLPTWPATTRLLPLFLLLAGCDVIPPPSADPTHYYVLSGSKLAPENTGRVAEGRLRLGLKSIELASYLRTRTVVVRSGSNEIMLNDFNRWAEPLQDGIARVLRARLLANPTVGSVAQQPFPLEGERDYDIGISVIRCEGSLSPDGQDTASFTAVIEISTTGLDPHVVTRKTFMAPETSWNGKDFAQLVGLLSDDAGLLGKQVIAALPPGAP